MKEQRGLTLVEVLIAMAILAVGLVMILSGFGTNLKMAEHSRQLAIAVKLTQVEMEHLKNINFPPTNEDREYEFNKVKTISPDDTEFEVEIISEAETGCQDTYGNDLLKKITVNIYLTGETAPLFMLRIYMARNGI